MGTIIAILLTVLGLFAQTAGTTQSRCTELTRKGRPCKNKAAEGNPHQVCGTHAAQLEREMAPKTLRVGFVAHPQRDFLQEFKTDMTALEAEVRRVLSALAGQYALEGVLSGNQTEWELARWMYRAKRPYHVLQPFEDYQALWPSFAKKACKAMLDNAESVKAGLPPEKNIAKQWLRAYTRSHELVAYECDLLVVAWIPALKGSSVEAAVKVASERGTPHILIELDRYGQPIRTVIRGEGERTPQ